MADELEQQLERIEHAVAEIVEAVQRLRDDRAAAGEAAGEINQRLRRFLERKNRLKVAVDGAIGSRGSAGLYGRPGK